MTLNSNGYDVEKY